MEIKCWGARGSIPVSGSQYVRYGGDTTCIEVTAESGETIIIDAGTGIRRLGTSLLSRNIARAYLLFTHVHWDHILGFGFFKPLQSGKMTLVVQDRQFSGCNTRDVFNEVLKPPFFPIGLRDFKAVIQYDTSFDNEFQIGSVHIKTIPISHPNNGLGYRFSENGRSFVFLTDNELGFDHPGSLGFNAYLDFSKDADLLFHDGEYTEQEYKKKSGWGHSSVTDVMDMAGKANVKQLGLFHINQDRTDDQMDKIVTDCRAFLKSQQSRLDCFAVACDMKILL